MLPLMSCRLAQLAGCVDCVGRGLVQERRAIERSLRSANSALDDYVLGMRLRLIDGHYACLWDIGVGGIDWDAIVNDDSLA